MTSLQETFESETSEITRKRRLHNESQTRYRKRQKTTYRGYRTGINLMDISIKHHELGRMDQVCIHCGAKFWIEERDQHSSQTSPAFAVCCAGGKVSLPPLFKPPSYLLDLYTSSSSNANSFRRNI